MSRALRSRSLAPLAGAAAFLLFIAVGYADAPAGRYTVTADLVTDTKTGLVWQRGGDMQMRTWADAKAACAALDLSGTGFRLPTAKEIQTIVDDTRVGPCVDPVFTPTVNDYYWTASPVATHPNQVWMADLDNGYTQAQDAVTPPFIYHYSRCVR